MDIRDHSENGNQREASSTGDIYEDIGSTEDLGNNKQDYYIMEKPGAETEQGDTVKLHNERKEKRKLPDVNKGIPGHCENGKQREASATDESYEDVSNSEVHGTDKQDYYIIPGAKQEQDPEMYLNTGTNNDVPEPIVRIRDEDDEDVYEEIEDYMNVSAK
ncbi:uncharacterized protein LOC110452825 [Mizuhopecten yessoensis]|uniref:uncharacterized protein LOC110452825 n=1 Tax=Mizuhopecten yessoensis TaxID=6573 RepID=UPI000B458024|nr:uncharacterized protein LOC110452825 [Mizuhopecten yessoensis]